MIKLSAFYPNEEGKKFDKKESGKIIMLIKIIIKTAPIIPGPY